MTYPDEYTELEWLGTKPDAPWYFGNWGDLLDPNQIHDFVWAEEDE